jgi:hypothetical protein
MCLVLKRTIWTCNTAFKSLLVSDPTGVRCESPETMENLLYISQNRALAGRALMLALSQHTGENILGIILRPQEIVFNKLHQSILLHLQDSKTQKVIILLLREIKRDTVYRHAQLKNPKRQEELQLRIQAHLLSVVKKVMAFLEYHGVL